MNVKQKLIVAASAATLTVGGLAAGLASTGGTAGAQTIPPAVQNPASSTTSTPTSSSAAPKPAAEAPGAETQDGPAAENDSADAPETPGAAEKADPSDSKLPGGGHADATGNADHQFEGVE